MFQKKQYLLCGRCSFFWILLEFQLCKCYLIRFFNCKDRNPIANREKGGRRSGKSMSCCRTEGIVDLGSREGTVLFIDSGRQDSGGGATSQPPAQVRQEPLFHSVPPRPQRLLHSEAYIKYIEGLNKDSKSMCNWDRQLNVTQEVRDWYEGNKIKILISRWSGVKTSPSCLWPGLPVTLENTPRV